MKKSLLTVLLLGATAAASAAPGLNTVGSFTGPAVEAAAGVSKADVKNVNLNEDNEFDAAVRGSYNAQLGDSNWISGVEASLKPVHRTIGETAFGDVKQKADASVSYVQGYRVANDLMAYGKVGYHYGKFNGAVDDHMNGVGYGAGLKYAVAPNVEVGGEWEQTRFKKDDVKVNNNAFMATVGYRFK